MRNKTSDGLSIRKFGIEDVAVIGSLSISGEATRRSMKE
jgi:hypothetical protein